jgi:hypothetical protein
MASVLVCPAVGFVEKCDARALWSPATIEVCSRNQSKCQLSWLLPNLRGTYGTLMLDTTLEYTLSSLLALTAVDA